MAHEISEASGRAEIAYAGETPWHGLGTKVDGLQTAQEMLRHAGLLWTVGRVPLFVESLPGGDRGETDPMIEVKGHVAIVRDDTKDVLGVASDRYAPIQNTQAADMVDALVTEGGAHVEVAGALGRGERCWMLARLPDDFEVVKGDLVRPYFLLAWGHDGKHGLAGKLTPVRVVCNNTLTAAGLGKGVKWALASDVYVRHSANATVRIEEARAALGIVRKQTERTAESYRTLAAATATDEQVAQYFDRVFPLPVDADLDGEIVRNYRRRQETLAEIYATGAGADLGRGTLWGAYNAVTNFIDHGYPVLKSGEWSRARQQSTAFGHYAGVRTDALEAALALANK